MESTIRPAVTAKEYTREWKGIEALALTIATIFLIGRPQDFVPVIGMIQPSWIASALLILSIFFFSSKSERSMDFIRYPDFRLTVLFFILIYASITYAHIQSISFTFLIQFIPTPLYFYCLCKSSYSTKALKTQLWVVTWTMLFFSLMSFVRSRGVERVHVGTMYDPNDLALIMVTSIPLIYSLSVAEKGFLRKALIVCTIGMSTLTIILTKSRGGFLGLTISMLCLLFVRTSITKSALSFRKKLLIVVVSLTLVSFGGDTYWDRVGTIFTGSETGSGRTGLWMRALEMIQDHPIIGAGVKNFSSVYGRRLSRGQFENMPSVDIWAPHAWATAHNTFILVSAELGLPGLFVYCAIIISCFISLHRVRKKAFAVRNEELFLTAGLLAVSFIGFITCAFFLSFLYQPHFFFLVAICIVLRFQSDMLLNRKSSIEPSGK